MTQETDILKSEQLDEVYAQLKTRIIAGVQNQQPVYEVELLVWQKLLQLGRELLALFFDLHGSGDMGETVELPDGRICQRLDRLHGKRYVSVFGEFRLERTAYGSREGQTIEFVPLDNRLQLPEQVFSYVLQDWSQSLCVEEAFGKASACLERIFGFRLSVDSLEGINEHAAGWVEDFRDDRAAVDPAEEGEILVLSADGKGVVMRRDQPAQVGHRTKGEKSSQKRIAIVGTAYTVDRHDRTPEQVVAALFGDREALPTPRPEPKQKHVWASLPQANDQGLQIAAVDIVYPWLLNEVVERNRRFTKEMVCLHDGQETLWDARERYLPKKNCVDILELLHVTPRLWKAAHVFHKERSHAAEQFVRKRLLRILHGQSAKVVRGLRVMASKHQLKGSRKKTITKVCNYFDNNKERMRYDEYLAKGYPIASGVIEGACRHLVKDRMERAGMHWKIPGAQAMLNLRSTWVDDDWDAYQGYYRQRENNRLYPYRRLVEGTNYQMAI